MPDLLNGLQLGAEFTYQRLNTPFDGIPRAAVDNIRAFSNFQYYSNDFIRWEGPNTAGEAGGWTLTETAAGLGNTNRVDIDDSAQYGVLKITTDDGDNDLENLQMTGEPWRYTVGEPLWFFCRVKTSDADDGEMFIGLALTDTSLIASNPTDGLFFEKAETATALDFHARKDGASAELTAVTAAFADDTYRIIGFHVDTSGTIHVYDGLAIDNLTEVGKIAAGNANLPNDEDLTLSLSFQTGAALTKSMALDWLLVAQG